MSAQERYLETRVPLSGDPLRLSARLAEEGPYRRYVLYERDDTWHYAGGSVAELTVTCDRVTLETADGVSSRAWRENPLPEVHRLLGEVRQTDWKAYGWASFELAYALAGRRDGLESATLLHLVIPAVEVRVAAGEAVVRYTDPDRLAQLRRLLTDESGPRPALEPVPASLGDAEPYHAAVASTVSTIRSGVLQKVVLSRVVEVTDEIDLPATYLAGRIASTPARSFLLNLGGVEAAGFSPETVVEVKPDGSVSTQPLAGTRALTGDAEHDARLRAELLADEKEVYEHAVSVQVAWDEMTTVCESGTVNVADFMGIKRRGSVQHIASRVTGRLASRADGPWGALGALFPAVTASGAPKSAAYDLIRAHEPEDRGLYSGAVLTVGSDGEMDAALALRAVFRRQGRTWLRAGAGIVSQSRPAREYEETCEKLRSVSRFLVPAQSPSVVRTDVGRPGSDVRTPDRRLASPERSW